MRHLDREHSILKLRKMIWTLDTDLGFSHYLLIIGEIVAECKYITLLYIILRSTYTHSQYSVLWIFSLNHLEFQCVEEEFRVNISNEHLNIHRNFPTGIF